MVLGNIASKRNNEEQAVKFWQQAAEAAASDSTYRDVERQVLGNIAGVYLSKARNESAPKDARVAAAKQAADAYKKLVAIPGATGQAAARQSLSEALLIAGDTTAATQGFGEMASNPGNFDYQDLINGAVTAARTNKHEDAAKLFTAALEKNPYSRDALFNLAVTDITLKRYDQVGPIVTRLVAIDPGNPQNFLLGARAAVEVAKTRSGAKAQAAANDTTLMWYTKGSQLPIEVEFNEFTPSEKQIELAGTILDRRDKALAAEDAGTAMTRSEADRAAKARAAKVKAMPAKTVTLKFEAIDKAGTVLGTQSVTTEPLTPGKSANFRVAVPAENAVAYRYTIAE
jgi:tetratricopeptide (TPR) repeat protein